MLSEKRILVLGGAGFIGSHVTHRLVELGAKVRVLSRPGRSVQNLTGVIDDIELVFGNFSDEGHLRTSLEGIDQVVHLISTTFPATTTSSGIYDIESNIIPTLRLLQECVNKGVQKLVYLSSGGTVYGEPKTDPITEDHALDPKSIYGQSKKVIESYIEFFVRTRSLNTTTLRVSNAFGPRHNPYGVQGLIGVAMACAIENRTVTILGDGSAERDYIYVDDVVAGVIAALSTETADTVNLSSGQGRSVSEVLDTVERVSGRPVLRRFDANRDSDVNKNVLCNQRARTLLNWSPQTEFEDGMRKTWQWIQSELGTLKPNDSSQSGNESK
ncbi:NAD-dependent epimerase/dehydratase family protein [Rhodopirellula sallentina]|uniref:UDP-glucose 4-epimerase n=1 Tax=Rhodopirellula sallentina SM41 TaxID=1263870 RepID=M5TT97_9BACT|nr:NAD-dependent epimerase/dehydratase family protein [Rhodopirellula sallentina]EMI52269.1 UDP-glucose 4-epimerase [Rhodopirellula sallentina SM41]